MTAKLRRRIKGSKKIKCFETGAERGKNIASGAVVSKGLPGCVLVGGKFLLIFRLSCALSMK